MRNRNIAILKKIIQYSKEISGTIERFELDYDKFKNDYVVKNAIAMCILQIGELAGKLTDEFKSAYNKMKWRDIVSIRNRTAHAYGTMDTEILWKTATDKIPGLKDYCENIINEIETKAGK